MDKLLGLSSKNYRKSIKPIPLNKLSPDTSSKDLITSFNKLKKKYPGSQDHVNKSRSNLHLMHSFDFASPTLNKAIKQQINSDRLTKGGNHVNVKINKFETFYSESKLKEFETKNSENEQSQLNSFIGSFKYLQNDIKNELVLNFQLVKQKSESLDPKIKLDGLIFSLQDQILNLSKCQIHTFSQFSQEVLDLNKPIREMIRLMKIHNIENGGELIETFWKTTLKLIDNALTSHFFNMSILSDKIQENSKILYTKYSEEICIVKEKYEKKLENLQNENEIFKNNLKDLRNKYKIVDEQFKKNSEKLKIIEDYGNRVKDMKKMKKLIEGIDSYICDSEREKTNQINAMKAISKLIEEIDYEGEKKYFTNNFTQTDDNYEEKLQFYNKYSEFIKNFEQKFSDQLPEDVLEAFFDFTKRRGQERKQTRRKTKQKENSYKFT